jgi:hypothetical protein
MDGNGQVVAVVGEPGVGKSRLYWEFTRSHRIAGALVLESRSKIGLRRALSPLSELEGAFVHMRDSLSAAERLQDSARIALSCTGLAHILFISGRSVEALPYGLRALEAATILDDRQPYIAANMILGVTHFTLGNYRQGREYLGRSVELTQSDLRRGASLTFAFMLVCANSRAWLGADLVETGRVRPGHQCSQRSGGGRGGRPACAHARQVCSPMVVPHAW